ncbi:ATP-binding protein [Aquabacterium sp.]|uniref:hybrid sensor histidine kinase/response regulator n=1 Tax=Aquabacterium sp. TaxID=1872578 RepID=UPI003783671F
MAIWHKQVSTGIDSVVDNPEIVALYRHWLARYAATAEVPRYDDFAPEAHPELAGRLMVLRPDPPDTPPEADGDFVYTYYGADIQRHSGLNFTGTRVSAIGGDVGDFFLDRYRHVRRTRQPQYTVHFSDRARAVVTWERLILPVRDAQGRDWMVVYNTPLQSRQQLLEAVLNATSEGILALRAVRDDDGRLQDWMVLVANRQFCDLLGSEADEIVGRPVSQAIPDWPQLGLQALCRSAMAQTGGLSADLRARLGGRPRQLLAHVGPLGDGCVLRLTDVTERQQAEETLRASQERLREAQQLEAIGTLARGIAHDFNNIIGAMLSNIVLALQDVGSDHPARLALDELLKSGLRAKDLVSQVLTFGRQGKEPFVKLPLKPVVDEVAQSLRPLLPPDAEVRVRDAGRPLRILANPSQVHQLLMNLCTNARHAIEGKVRGRITLQLAERRLEPPATALLPGLAPGLYAVLSVSDNGIGMDEATRARVFEPFFTTKPVNQGTGLGLSVVHGIVTAHAGAITIASAPGQGTRFDVYLPALEPTTESTGPGGLDEVRGHGEHVLCVDDDQTMLLVLQRMLERGGYRVSAFDLPQQALAALKLAPRGYDVLVTDYNMPVTDGLQLAAQASALRPGLPIVMYSGFISDELRADAQRAGISRIVPKANSYDELPAVVRQLLRGSAAD